MNGPHWTQLAKDCYRIGCTCSKCDLIPERYKGICQVEKAVMELVRVKGKPDYLERRIDEPI